MLNSVIGNQLVLFVMSKSLKVKQLTCVWRVLILVIVMHAKHVFVTSRRRKYHLLQFIMEWVSRQFLIQWKVYMNLNGVCCPLAFHLWKCSRLNMFRGVLGLQSACLAIFCRNLWKYKKFNISRTKGRTDLVDPSLEPQDPYSYGCFKESIPLRPAEMA